MIIGVGIGAINSVRNMANIIIAGLDFMPLRFITLPIKNAAMMNGEESNSHMNTRIGTVIITLAIYSITYMAFPQLNDCAALIHLFCYLQRSH